MSRRHRDIENITVAITKSTQPRFAMTVSPDPTPCDDPTRIARPRCKAGASPAGVLKYPLPQQGATSAAGIRASVTWLGGTT